MLEYDLNVLATKEDRTTASKFGLIDDCFAFPGIYTYIRAIAGGTLAAVRAIAEDAQIAINWGGGRHHAQPAKANGFCYVNDIVLGICSYKLC